MRLVLGFVSPPHAPFPAPLSLIKTFLPSSRSILHLVFSPTPLLSCCFLSPLLHTPLSLSFSLCLCLFLSLSSSFLSFLISLSLLSRPPSVPFPHSDLLVPAALYGQVQDGALRAYPPDIGGGVAWGGWG